MSGGFEHLLTAGAQRAMERAIALAMDQRAERVGAAHLLWALALEESKAAELLAARGLGLDELHRRLPLEPEWPEDIAWEMESGDVERREPVPDDIVRAVLHEARREMGQYGGVVEVTTEQMLTGLLLVDSPVAELLREFGWAPPRNELAEVAALLRETAPIATDARVELAGGGVVDQTDALRLLDAAANRVREGIRVVEDYARFAKDDRALVESLKGWRHEFSRLMGKVSERGLLASRDTEADVGTTVRTRHDLTRESLLDVVRAALKRAQEGMRTVEETAKVVQPDLAEPFGALRYRLYTVEKWLLAGLGSREQLAGRPLYLLLTEELCHHGSGPAVKGAIAGGCGIIQIREKNMPDRRLIAHARRVREWTRAADCLLIMNDRPDLAVLCEADGVHVGQDELSVHEVRRIVGPDRLVGVSTHSLEEAIQAARDGADYIGVGPVFPSTTKAFDTFVGLDLVRAVSEGVSLPAYAIGGITTANVGDVVRAGARGVAVSAAICGADDPQAAAKTLRAHLPG
jgi:thiamine-phosphate pyrophosphorylase